MPVDHFDWKPTVARGIIMGIIGWVVLGLIAGTLAKVLLPGDDPGGFIVTTIIGIVGALIGGVVAKALGFGDPIDEFFDFSTWVAAIIGSIVLLLLYRLSAAADADAADSPSNPLT